MHTQVGRIDVTAMLLHDKRVTVRTYLPADYEWSGHDYRVIYMFDGHNLFDVRTATFNQEWRIDETMESLSERGLEPAVVVGIDAPENKFERYRMYSVGEWAYRKHPDGRVVRRIVGDGAATAQFLLGDVKAATEQRYRVRQDRDGVGVGGSSMGGYMSLYCAARYPELVSRVIAMSPAVFDHPMRGFELRALLAEAGAPQPQRFWIDMGDEEDLEYVDGTPGFIDALWSVRDALSAAGHTEVAAHVIAGGKHDERSWADRFEQAYRWAFDGVEPDLP
jgi:enterochelin esterase-like enzyme